MGDSYLQPVYPPTGARFAHTGSPQATQFFEELNKLNQFLLTETAKYNGVQTFPFGPASSDPLMLGAMQGSGSALLRTPETLQIPTLGQSHETDPQQRQRAIQGSELPLIQERIHRGLGITGRGVNTAVIDIPAMTPEGRLDNSHGEAVSSLMAGQNGVAPGANNRFINLTGNEPAEIPLPQDNIRSMNNYVIDRASMLPELMSNRLEELMQQRDMPRVVNASLGDSKIQLADHVAGLLSERDEQTGNYRYANMRRQIYGPNDANLTPEQRNQLMMNYINQVMDHDLDNNGKFSRTMQRYQEVTRQADERGMMVIVPTGNQRPHDRQGVRFNPSDELNFLSISNHVLSVGAINTNGTPGDRRDDTIAQFSAGGAVDLVAPGEEVAIPLPGGQTLVTDGSSFASPYVAGTVALMLQANPNLTTAEIRDILAETATQPQQFDRNSMGAGVVDPELAVRVALRLRQLETQPAAR